MTDLWQQANQQLRELVSYEPGKPIEEVARELGLNPDEIVKLASNENPRGIGPRTRAAIELPGALAPVEKA